MVVRAVDRKGLMGGLVERSMRRKAGDGSPVQGGAQGAAT